MAHTPSDQVSPHNGGLVHLQPGGPNDIALDQLAQCKRYGRSVATLHRWRTVSTIAYPHPNFYISGVPYIWLSVLLAWEARQPAQSQFATKMPGRQAAPAAAP